MEGEKVQSKPQENKEETVVQSGEVTTEGNKLSKNEQKRLEKQKKLQAQRAEKAAKRAEEAKTKTDKPKQEEILDPTQYFENRSKMIN